MAELEICACRCTQGTEKGIIFSSISGPHKRLKVLAHWISQRDGNLPIYSEVSTMSIKSLNPVGYGGREGKLGWSNLKSDFFLSWGGHFES